MERKLCPNCFQLLDGDVKFCKHCGSSTEQDWDLAPLALRYGTVLGGRYVTGKVLGQGGFGITYCAYDYQNAQRVAVKEFFPDTLAGRGAANSIFPYTGQKTDDFNYGKAAFLEEAKTLAQFIHEPEIVHIYSYFEEFGTAYFAMEYVDGVSLQTYVEKSGGRLSWEETKRILTPMMDALAKVHSRGIIHRDIKPDNIYLTKQGQVKILDFGSARYSMGEKSRSLDVVLTHGFAPREQYSRHGRQGAYTDVYALAATFYFCVTGKKPQDSIDRMDEDCLAAPGRLGAKIPPAEEDVLMKALSVEPQDRYQTMPEFRQALERAAAGPAARQTAPAQQAAQPIPVRQPVPVQPPVQNAQTVPLSQPIPVRPPVQNAQPVPLPQPVPAQPQVQNAQPGAARPPVQPAAPGPAAAPPKKKSKAGLIVLIAALSSALVLALGVLAVVLIAGRLKNSLTPTTPVQAAVQTVPPEQAIPAWSEHSGGSQTVNPAPIPAVTQTPQPSENPPHSDPPPQTEAPADYAWLDALNRKYDGYFDFTPDRNGFVIPDSDVRRISSSELDGMTEHQVCMARNEIYARHGHVFNTAKYADYFACLSWYTGVSDGDNLSATEKANLEVIKAYEKARGW